MMLPPVASGIGWGRSQTGLTTTAAWTGVPGGEPTVHPEFMYDERTLGASLWEAGFRDVRRPGAAGD